MAATSGVTTPPTDLNDTDLHPVWNDDGKTDVQSLFKNPYFVDGNSTGAGELWYANMQQVSGGSMILFDKPGGPKNTVYTHGGIIYRRLAPGQDMPYPVPDHAGRWPAEALEKFRLWFNDGGWVSKTDPIYTSGPQITAPTPPPPPTAFKVPANPVWDAPGTPDDDIKQCFTNPCWIVDGPDYAQQWQAAMGNFQYDANAVPIVPLNLQMYENVKGWARVIYTHLASRSMPISESFFSDEACEAIRL